MKKQKHPRCTAYICTHLNNRKKNFSKQTFRTNIHDEFPIKKIQKECSGKKKERISLSDHIQEYMNNFESMRNK
jgi:hypothetical protein